MIIHLVTTALLLISLQANALLPKLGNNSNSSTHAQSRLEIENEALLDAIIFASNNYHSIEDSARLQRYFSELTEQDVQALRNPVLLNTRCQSHFRKVRQNINAAVDSLIKAQYLENEQIKILVNNQQMKLDFNTVRGIILSAVNAINSRGQALREGKNCTITNYRSIEFLNALVRITSAGLNAQSNQ